ncbi:hypothetical protein [Nesterenkonia suensis]
MTEQSTAAPTVPLRPQVVWPTTIGRDVAIRRVVAKIPGAGGSDSDLSAELHLHPMLAVEFLRRRPRLGSVGELRAHALVDLVGGRAYVAEPWTEIDFLPREQVRPGEPPPPIPPARIGRTEAVETARRMIGGVMLRRRRLDTGAPLELAQEPLCFAKPNWWVTGTCAGREVEVVVDAITGRHYAFRA